MPLVPRFQPLGLLGIWRNIYSRRHLLGEMAFFTADYLTRKSVGRVFGSEINRKHNGAGSSFLHYDSLRCEPFGGIAALYLYTGSGQWSLPDSVRHIAILRYRLNPLRLCKVWRTRLAFKRCFRLSIGSLSAGGLFRLFRLFLYELLPPTLSRGTHDLTFRRAGV